MVDEETMALLSQYKGWGKSHSWMVRYAIAQYERARLARNGKGVSPSSTYQEVEITYD